VTFGRHQERNRDFEIATATGFIFPAVRIESGRVVTVFNVCGNSYRLITAIHYDKQRVFTLRLLTHADYDKNRWKKEL